MNIKKNLIFMGKIEFTSDITLEITYSVLHKCLVRSLLLNALSGFEVGSSHK